MGYRWIKRGANFKRALDACQGEHDQRMLRHRTPDIWWAYHIWMDDKDPTRVEIEARILARCDDFEIGVACGIAPEIIQAYECLFFNVREKLNHPSYVMHQVIGSALQHGLSEREFEVLWKLYGYFLGPQVLQALMSKFVDPHWCSTPDTISAVVQDDAVGTLKLKAALAAKTVPVSYNTQTDLLHIFTKFVEIERTTDSAGKAQDQMLEHIMAMLSHLPFNIAGLDPQNEHQPVAHSPVHKFRETAMELSFHETMAVAAGQELPYLDQVQDLKFPPSPTVLKMQEAPHEEDK